MPPSLPLPIPPGNYDDLAVNGKALFWRSFAAGERQESTLQAIALGPDGPEVETVAEKVTRFELSADGTKLLILKAKEIHLADAVPDKPDSKKTAVDLAPWNFVVDPREEWRQMFAEAWRLERDHFYDRGMHGNDWPAIRRKYEPLLPRVTDREELNDLIGEMVSELGALHIFIRPGDVRKARPTCSRSRCPCSAAPSTRSSFRPSPNSRTGSSSSRW